MNRRNLITAAAALGVQVAAAATKNAIFEPRDLRMRNGAQIQRTSGFFSKHYIPAAQRIGIGPLGFFNALVAEQSPFLLAVSSFSSIAAMETALEKMAADKEFQKGFSEYNSMSEPSYVRMESSLLRAFDSIPAIEVPP